MCQAKPIHALFWEFVVPSNSTDMVKMRISEFSEEKKVFPSCECKTKKHKRQVGCNVSERKITAMLESAKWRYKKKIKYFFIKRAIALILELHLDTKISWLSFDMRASALLLSNSLKSYKNFISRMGQKAMNKKKTKNIVRIYHYIL